MTEKLFPLFFIDNCIHKFLNKLFIKRIRDSTTNQKKKTTIFLEHLGKILLLAKKQLKALLEVAVKMSNLKSFSKHQIDSATHLDLKTSYTNKSIQKCYINISATFVLHWQNQTPFNSSSV